MSWEEALRTAVTGARATGYRWEIHAKFWPWLGTRSGWAYYPRCTGRRWAK